MKNNFKILKFSLLAGSFYFFLVSVAHLWGIKIPGLFIYFNIPSYSYQDNIVAFFSLGWSFFFYIAFVDPVKYLVLVKAILIAGAAAIIVLCYINIRTDFILLNNSAKISIFWVQIVILFFYWFWLVVFYFRLKKKLD